MKTHLSFEFLEKATETLRSIAHPIRFAMVEMLFREKKMTVSDIHDSLDIEQAVASHHLRILKDKGVVRVERDGKSSIYSLSDESYYKIVDILISTL